MNEAKKVALVGMLQNQIGLSSADVGEILDLVVGKASGGVVPPQAPGELAPDVLMQPGEAVMPRPQAERLQEFATTISQFSTELRSGSGWRSRKLWVTLVTLAGMLVQLPMQEILPPVSQILICALAGLYIAVQGILDAPAKPRPLEPAA
jgi:hypothetical protein